MATWKQENIMLTKVGEQALTNAEAGEGKITITKVIGSSFSQDDIYNVNSKTQISENITFSIVEKENLDNNVGTSIHIQAVNKNLATKFRLNTIVVYATHDSIGSGPFPYMIAKAENADEISTPDITPTTLNYSLTIVNTRGGLLNITITPAGLVPMATFTKAKQSIEEKIGNNIEAHNTDEHAHDKRFNAIIEKVNNMITPTDDADKQRLAPTLALVKTLLSNLNIKNSKDVINALDSETLSSLGVRYDLSNPNAWYISFGKLFGGLIIQGGRDDNGNDNQSSVWVTFPLSFNRCFTVVATIVGGSSDSIKVYQYTNTAFEKTSYYNFDETKKVTRPCTWIAVGN